MKKPVLSNCSLENSKVVSRGNELSDKPEIKTLFNYPKANEGEWEFSCCGSKYEWDKEELPLIVGNCCLECFNIKGYTTTKGEAVRSPITGGLFTKEERQNETILQKLWKEYSKELVADIGTIIAVPVRIAFGMGIIGRYTLGEYKSIVPVLNGNDIIPEELEKQAEDTSLRIYNCGQLKWSEQGRYNVIDNLNSLYNGDLTADFRGYEISYLLNEVENKTMVEFVSGLVESIKKTSVKDLNLINNLVVKFNELGILQDEIINNWNIDVRKIVGRDKNVKKELNLSSFFGK